MFRQIPLESDAGCAVIGCVNDAAALKAPAGDEMQHGFVVLMGIDTQVVDLCGTKIDAGIKNAMSFPVRRDAVDGAVFLGIVDPGSVFDELIGRIRPDDKGENAPDLTVLFNDVSGALFDVAQDFFFGRKSVSPLGRVPVFLHQFPRVAVGIHYLLKIRGPGVSYVHYSSLPERSADCVHPGI